MKISGVSDLTLLVETLAEEVKMARVSTLAGEVKMVKSVETRAYGEIGSGLKLLAV